MADGNKLSDRMQARINRSKTKSYKTRVKRDKSGKRIGGGTTVNQSTVDAVLGDERVQVIVEENNAHVIADAINSGLVAALEEIGLVAEASAKRRCPVDTGRLRNSITHALSGEDSVVIGTNVEYAIYVHEGTSRMKGRPFLRDAVANSRSRFEAIIRKHIQGA